MFASLRRFFARCLPTTPAGKASMITAVILVITVAVAWTVFGRTDSVGWWHAMTWWRFTATLALVVLSCLVLYFLISRWGEYFEEPLYDDIYKAWTAGIDALNNAGMSPKSAPLFVVLGSSGGQLEQSMVESMRSSGLSFKIEDIPSAAGVDHALRWYATDDAIYLFCSKVGAQSKLARQWSMVVPTGWESLPGPGRLPGNDPTRTLAPGLTAEYPSPPGIPNPVAVAAGSQQGSAPAFYEQTIRPEDIEALRKKETSGETLMDRKILSTSHGIARLPSQIDVSKESNRLQYLCQLLKRARFPLCGLNGIVTLLPFELVEAGGPDLEALRRSIRTDLDTIRETLWVRFPVSALLVGMERARGFGEFVGLLETSNREKRLGAGFDALRRATGERLRGLSDGICDAFEDWVYALYRQRDALAPERQVANIKLYNLLCRVRTYVKPKLNTVLCQAFEIKQDNAALDFFSGCYLGATGSSAMEQAFIKGLLHDKLVPQQNNVEWTDKAIRIHRLYNIMTWVGWSVVVVLFLALLLILWLRL